VINTQAVNRLKDDLEDGVEGYQAGAYRDCLCASSFQTMTMAMQRARPIMINPIMYSGLGQR
jgi:hypothetical protein